MQNKKQLLIPYFTAGFPSKSSFSPTLKTLSSAGADYIEVGVPHSDPLADGPTIQYSSKVALKNGVNLKWVVDSTKKIKDSKNISPLILFSYFNPILEYGLEKLLKDLPKPLFYGAIIPDLPLEEAKKYISIFRKHNLKLILLAAPTTKKEKIKKIAKESDGFIYLVSVAGVTGERTKVSTNLKSKIKEIKSLTKKPVAVGFGIKSPKQAQEVLSYGADGVIIGSAIISLMKDSPNGSMQKKLELYIKSIKKSSAK